ncbi:Ax21 family protein [Marilutibacter chinensis]|uniref:Ax21 family protein n=1 Tax=Marilutibacter chinensis TaxID=2912247 RepID=A0ABS9HVB4_9GAMM|nr:Ax21 family protein [Lysobacter chinensis]MCF7222834.1 Ax21 family protein [Lysobacter chinensis]
MKRSLTISKLAALSLIAALPFAASAAEGVSYTYVEGGYAATNTDGNDADGWAIGGSGAIAPNFHIFGNYSNQDIDGTNLDFDQWRVGVGYNHEINRNVDLLTRVAYEKFDAGRGFDADGWSVEAGVRGAFTPNFEGYALAGYEDFDEIAGQSIDGEFYGRLGALVKFNQTWGINGDVKFVDGDTQWFVGPRASF